MLKPLVAFLAILISNLFITHNATAQKLYTIGGTVKDEKGQEVSYASVFLSGSERSTQTDAKGNFKLVNIPAGNYILIVSMLGYTKHNQNITINDADIYQSIKLSASATSLKAVVIGNDLNRAKHLEMFEKYFIGQSSNAKRCVLLNPDVLFLHYNKKKGILTANSDDFLILENKALGYKIKCLLSEFTLDLKTRSYNYAFTPLFEELEGNKRTKSRWLRARQKAYKGSRMHFFRSAFSNNLKNNGFGIYSGKSLFLNEEINASLLFNSVNQDFITAKIDGSMYVIYRKEKTPPGVKESGNYLNVLPFSRSNTGQVSTINMLSDYVIIDKNGNYIADPKHPRSESLEFSGYWAWENAGDLLPIEYKDTQPVIEDKKDGATAQIDEVKKLMTKVERHQQSLPTEKLFMHFDKPYYSVDDTLWYKAYLVNSFLEPSEQSGFMYLEIVDNIDTVVSRSMVALSAGLANGYVHFNTTQYPEGNYTLRAYTNWMRNFGEDYIFQKSFYIGNVSQKTWLVNYKTQASKENSGNVRLNLGFNTISDQRVGFRNLHLRVLSGKKEIFKSKAQTSADGLLDLNFTLPQNVGNQKLSIIAKDLLPGAGNGSVTIPIKINRPENTDVQFMPEGGKLINGIESKIGFKAIDEEGKGVAVEGGVYNSAQQKVASFKTLHAGMGAFFLKPEPNETYMAKVTISDGITKNYPLPTPTAAGTALQISSTNDSLKVSIRHKPSTTTQTNPFYLVGQSRGVIYCGAKIVLKTEERIITIAKNMFPSGITRIVLLNELYQPLNERLVYITSTDALAIELNPHKLAYAVRDSINLGITVKEADGEPSVEGSYSLSVTNDALVKPDSIFGANILTRLLLTSELKGNIEFPGYFFQKNKEQELDALLLTQGWIAYNWDIINTPVAVKPKHEAEKEFKVKGTVMNMFNKPLTNVSVSMLSINPVVIKQSFTDSLGVFTFKEFPALDTAVFKIQALNKNGKSFNIGVKVDEFIPPVFSQHLQAEKPWYVNTDTALLKTQELAMGQQQKLSILRGRNMLKEVIIKRKKVVKGSKSLNEPGVADQILDELDMLKARRMTLYEVLQKNIKGFGIRGIPKSTQIDYMVYEKVAHLVIDGIPVDDSYVPMGVSNREHLSHSKTYMDYFTAEDIKGIEVMYNVNTRYAAKVTSSDYTYDPLRYGANSQRHAYIEVTTRSGHGPSMSITPGTYLYKPMPFTWPREFYRPRYTSINKASRLDLRSTIHWAPNISTDASGKASVSFYAADTPGTYTAILQGVDMNGKLVFSTRKIVVK